jgi:N-dimethylarginine dimethylaminohydrolase
MTTGAPKTRKLLEKEGVEVIEVPYEEVIR